MDKGQALAAGEAFAKQHLKVIEAAHGSDIAAAYAAGYVTAARDRFLDDYGARRTWVYFFDTAENIMLWQNELERAGEV